MPATIRTLLALSLVASAAAPLQAQRRSDVITSEEIARVSGKGATAYDVVRSLRPRWLKSSDMFLEGGNNDLIKSEGAHVYLNDVDQGNLDYLKTIPTELVAELRWLSANEAGARFGPASGPGIVVTLKH